MNRTLINSLPAMAFAITFVIHLVPVKGQTITRGPYLQNGTPTSTVLRWRTDVATSSQVTLTSAAGSLTFQDGASKTDHEILATGLSPDTTYFYTVGAIGNTLAGGNPDHYLVTSPAHGTQKPTRLWVMGDSGKVSNSANDIRDMRDGYYAFNGGHHSDVWLMLGDNAYNDGTDAEYQTAVFDVLQNSLRNTTLWSTRGNHDRTTGGLTPYFDIFTLPTAGEGGGVASTKEDYYSFDYANIHFVCLDSYGLRTDPLQIAWLEQDLAATTQEWIIAFFHHPPYTKGSHDSDLESDLVYMRQVYLPILEQHGVDLVLNGHSHSYERSYFINGHYGSSSTYNAGTHALDAGDGNINSNGAYDKQTAAGTVQIVAGSSGKISFTNRPQHPCHYIRLFELGSLAIDVNGLTLDCSFVDMNGTARDTFRIDKRPPSGCTVDAGPNRSTDIANAAFLNGSGSCVGVGQQPTYTWEQISGPGTATISNPNSAGTTATFSETGTYTLRLTVNAGTDVVTDQMTVTVTSNNQAPAFDTCVTTTEIVTEGDTWKYLDDGSNQGTTWRALAFNDATWNSGNGQFGYGDGDEDTLLSFGGQANNKHRTTYFRKTVTLPADSTITAAQVRYMRDDGLAFHLNGTELFLDNLSAGYNSQTFAPTFISGANESAFNTYNLTAAQLAQLQAGDNVFAAEIHQYSTTSSDISFDAAIEITSASPCFITSGSVYASQSITLPTSASDPDQGTAPLAYSLTSGAQPGMSASPDGDLVWNVPPSQASGMYMVEMTVTDSYAIPASDSVMLEIEVLPNAAPQVSATGPSLLTLPSTAPLTAFASDDGIPGALQWSWTKSSGPGTVTFSDTSIANPTASFSGPGTYVMAVTASDGYLTDSATVTIQVSQNAAPTIQAPASANGNHPTSIVLAPVVFDDGLPGTTPLTYTWTSGVNLTFTPPNTASTAVTAPGPGVYTATLTVSDGQLSTSANVVLTFGTSNATPVVDAGADLTVTFPGPANLAGSVTDDGLPINILLINWSKIAGPGAATFTPNNSPTTSAVVGLPGVYKFSLSASDGAKSDSDIVVVNFVQPNQAPIVNAGDDQVIALPDTATLEGIVSDDGLPSGNLTIQWTQLAGPGAPIFSDPNSRTPTVSFTQPGNYVFQITADDEDQSRSDTMAIEVQPPGGSTTVTATVSAGKDDAEYYLYGDLVYVGSVDLDLGSIASGVRFDNIWIPDGVSIQSARLIMHSYRPGTACDVSITGHATDDAPSFDQPNNCLQANEPTDSVVAWNIPPTPNGIACITPNIGPVIEEIIQRPGWVSGNAIALKLSTVAGLQETMSYEYDPALAARLEIQYVAAGANTAPEVDAGPDLTGNAGIPTPLDATIFDDGIPNNNVSIQWTRISGPGLAVFNPPNIEDPVVTFTDPGIYVIRVTANDGALVTSDEITVTVGGNLAFATVPIAGGANDGEGYRAYNYSYTTSRDLDIGAIDSGVRFRNLSVPPGSIIHSAVVRFTSFRGGSGANINVAGLASDSSPDFAAPVNGLNSGPLTQTLVPWNIPPVPQSQTFESPNLSGIVQELIDRPGWNAGQHISLILLRGAGRQEASTYEDAPSKAPVLLLTYEPPQGAQRIAVAAVFEPSGIRTFDTPVPERTTLLADGVELPSLVYGDQLLAYVPPSVTALSIAPSKAPLRFRTLDALPVEGAESLSLLLDANGLRRHSVDKATNLLLGGFTGGAVVLDTYSPWDPILLNGAVMELPDEFGVYLHLPAGAQLEARDVPAP